MVLDAAAVGITAGTSTPDEVIDRVDRHIRALTAGGLGVRDASSA